MKFIVLLHKPAPLLFNLKEDISESQNLAALTARLKELDAEITENARPVWRKK